MGAVRVAQKHTFSLCRAHASACSARSVHPCARGSRIVAWQWENPLAPSNILTNELLNKDLQHNIHNIHIHIREGMP